MTSGVDPLNRPCDTYARGLIQSVSCDRAHLLPDEVRSEVSGLAREAMRRRATCGELRDVLMHSGALSRFLAAVQEADFAMRKAKRHGGQWVRPASSFGVDVS